MRIILSRKGFDSSFGGGPSPILPDGTFVSLPIPTNKDSITYSDLQIGPESYSTLLNQLGYTNLEDSACHLDPDLSPTAYRRHPDWRPLFGQVGAAQGHLDNNGIGSTDMFLFFGWFRHTVYDSRGRLRFDPQDKAGRHVIFGYLQVDYKLQVTPDTTCPDWMAYHPHMASFRRERRNNTIYVAREKVTWDSSRPGGGVLRYHPSLVLTAPGQKKSCWALPTFFRGLRISYHRAASWTEQGCLQSAHKGQEFVVESSDCAAAWAQEIISVK